ncbi:MAG: hypothetical protein ACOCYP_09345 [Planctomycetota bacterium]
MLAADSERQATDAALDTAFTAADWQRIRHDSEAWWAGRLDRPLVPLHLRPAGAAPGAGACPPAFALDDLSPAQAVDRWTRALAGQRHAADGFPWVYCDYGPGVTAAFLGCRAQVDTRTVWFHPPEPRPAIAHLHLAYNEDSPCFARVVALMRAAMERWRGRVLLSTTDLGGTLDILAAFRPGVELPLDLYDHPAEVERLVDEIHRAWFAYYDRCEDVLQPSNPGHTAWSGIYASGSYYMLQCDFAYMISPAMFDRFVRPELAASCRRLDRSFYHLDGPGQLPHLDSILSIAELDGVQWIPGTGQPPCEDWPEIYTRIRAAGKLAQFLGSIDEFERLVQRIGRCDGFVLGHQTVDEADFPAVARRLEALGVPPVHAGAR